VNLLSLLIASSLYQASPGQNTKPSMFPMLPHCDSSRKLGSSDVGEIDPTLDSDSLTQFPPLKTMKRELGDQFQVYQFYIGKRGKLIMHGLYQRVTQADGKVVESGHYSHNKPIGRWTTWYYTGEVQTEMEYQNGKPNGKHTSYHRNGLISEQQELVDGLPNCKEEYSFGYHENGKLHFESRVRNGYVIQDLWYDSLGLPISKKVHTNK
jgi:hypothetical protein